MPKVKSGYVVLTDAERATLVRYLSAEGDRVASQHFGLNKLTITRAASGCSVQRASALALRAGLAALLTMSVVNALGA